jgi:hypothetical protein
MCLQGEEMKKEEPTFNLNRRDVVCCHFGFLILRFNICSSDLLARFFSFSVLGVEIWKLSLQVKSNCGMMIGINNKRY